MKKIGFLSFGHWTPSPQSQTRSSSEALLQSIPSIDSVPRVRLPTITGSIPHPFNRPPGCPFHPRCAAAIEGRCDRDTPVLREVAADHRVSCFLYE